MIDSLYQIGIGILEDYTELNAWFFSSIPTTLATTLGISTSTTWLGLIAVPAIIIAVLDACVLRWVWNSIF